VSVSTLDSSSTSPDAFKPSPWLDIANTYQPRRFRTAVRMIRTAMETHPFVSAAIRKKAEWPLTDLVIHASDDKTRKWWEGMLYDILRWPTRQIETGMSYWAFGNFVISLYWPFQRYLVCTSCNKESRIEDVRWEFRSFAFEGPCPKCKHTGVFKVYDQVIRDRNKIRVIHWNLEHIDVDHVEHSDDRLYAYMIPAKVRSSIRMGQPRRILETVPVSFIEAVKLNRRVYFNPREVYHGRRADIPTSNGAWALPPVTPVLKALYMDQTFNKVSEVLANEYSVPLWVIFPQAGGEMDLYSEVDLRQWAEKVRLEFAKWRQDPGYRPIMPIPIGHQFIGGNAAQYRVLEDIKNNEERIAIGLEVSLEWLRGNWTYSGGSIQLKMMATHFKPYRQEELAVLNSFIIPRIAAFCDVPAVQVEYAPLRAADDVQRQQINLNAMMQDKLSQTTWMLEGSYDPAQEQEYREVERKRRHQEMVEDQEAQAKAMAAAEKILAQGRARNQMLAQLTVLKEAQKMILEGEDPNAVMMAYQQAMQGAAQGGAVDGQVEGNTNTNAGPVMSLPMDATRILEGWASQIQGLEPGQQGEAMAHVQQNFPDVAPGLQGQIDMRPMPAQKPPRRESAK